jgi:hypothetical protein
MGTNGPERTLRAIRLLGEYAARVDGGRFEEFPDLFTPDAVYAIGRKEIRGAEALRDFVAAAPPGIHLCGVPAIEDRGDHLVALSNFVFLAAASPTPLAGTYRDRIVDDGQVARFAERIVTISVRG